MSRLFWERGADGALRLSTGTSGSTYPIDETGHRMPEQSMHYNPDDSSDFTMDGDGEDDSAYTLHEPMTIAHAHDGLVTHYHDDDADHSGVDEEPEAGAPDSDYQEEYDRLRAQAEAVPRPSSGYMPAGLGGRKMTEEPPRRRPSARRRSMRLASEAAYEALVETDTGAQLDEQSDALERAALRLAEAHGVDIANLTDAEKLRLYAAASKWLPGYGRGGRAS